MVPGLETLLGSFLGGAFRLGQAFLEAREKQRDRDHEFRMTELQGTQAMAAAEARMREIGLEGDIRLQAADIQALVDGARIQADEARAAGGWVASLSGSVRPILTYALALPYIVHQFAEIATGMQHSGAMVALAAAYSEADMAVLSAILSFWFMDRSLRRGRSPLAA